MKPGDPGGSPPGYNPLLMEFDNAKTIKSVSPGPKYLVMRRIGEGSTMKGVSPFLIHRAIESVAGKVQKTNALRSGDLLIQTQDAKQANKLVKLIALNSEVKVDISEHERLNKVRGVIRCRELIGISNDEILFEMQDQYISEIRRLTRKENGVEIEIGTYFLTFSTTTLPDYVNIGFIRCSVKPYIPSPLRCFNCLKLNHSKENCRNSSRLCSNCGDSYHIDDDNQKCEKPPKCVNCFGLHNSLDKSCPKYIESREINRIKVVEQVSYREANNIYKSRNPLSFNRPFSSLFKNNSQHNIPESPSQDSPKEKEENTNQEDENLKSQILESDNEMEIEIIDENNKNQIPQTTPHNPSTSQNPNPSQRPSRSLHRSPSKNRSTSKVKKHSQHKTQAAIKNAVKLVDDEFIKEHVVTPREEAYLNKMFQQDKTKINGRQNNNNRNSQQQHKNL